MINAVFYARFSSHKQNEMSIEGQLIECKKFADMNGYNIISEYIDRGTSAKTDNRPQFQQMIKDSAKKEFERVIVYQLDRFSRNRFDSANYKSKLKKNGVKVVSAKENISEDPSGILVESMLEGMAEYYSSELSQKVNRNMRLNAEKGYFNGGFVPLGYKVELVNLGTYSKKKLAVDEETAPIVRKIFEMRANDEPIVEIIEYLNKKGYKNSKGTKFTKNSLQSLLNNKKYIGINSYGNKEYINVIPAIVDKKIFDKAILIKEKYRHSPGIGKGKERYLLTGKIFCGECKSPMVGISGNSKSKKVYRYYTCNKAKNKKCNKKSIVKEYIEDIVVKQCLLLLTEDNIRKIAKKIYKIYKEQINSNIVLKNLEKNKKKINKNIDNLFKALENGQNVCRINTRIEDNEKELAIIESEIYKEKEKMAEIDEEQIVFFLTKLKDQKNINENYKKALINILISEIYVYKEQTIIICKIGENPLTITVNGLSGIENNLVSDNFSFVARNGSP